MPVALGAIAVVVVAVVVVAWALARTDQGPREALQAYVNAKIAGDCEGVFAVTTEEYREVYGLTCPLITSEREGLRAVGTEVVLGEPTMVRGGVAEIVTDQTTWYGDSPLRMTVVYTVVETAGRWFVDAERLP